MADQFKRSYRDYTVGWICALDTELAAGQAMLDECHEPLPQPRHDHNNYALGRIGVHNVVIAGLPAGVTGITSAAKVATQMQGTFKHIKAGLMVGVGGGAPSEEKDIRLGDVAVSLPTDSDGGTIQYDLGKTRQEGKFHRTGSLNKPPGVLLTALTTLRARHLMKGYGFDKILSEAFTKYPNMATSFASPGDKQDVLYEASYDHPEEETTCRQCDESRVVIRDPRPSSGPLVHYGLIASANQVMRHGATREKLRREKGVICFEMEAAGLMDDFPCLVIRGICDYSDSHKQKLWQPYAAITAACYAKELLNIIPSSQAEDTDSITEIIGLSGSTDVVDETAGNHMTPQRYASPAPINSLRSRHISQTFNSSRNSIFEKPSPRNSQCQPTEDFEGGGFQIGNRAGFSLQSASSFSEPSEKSLVAENELQDALSHFELSLTVQQRIGFKKSTLKELRLTLQRIQQQHAARHKSMNLPRVQIFINAIQKLENASSFSGTSEFVSYVWGSVKFILLTASTSLEAFDILLNAYEKIGAAIGFPDTEAAWSSPIRRDDVLVKVYTIILHFHTRVLGYLGMSTWSEVFASLWKSFTLRMDFIVQDLRRHKELIETQATAAEIHENLQKRQMDLKRLEQLESAEMKTQSDAVLQWLAGADVQEDHDDICKVRHEFPGSGEWLCKHPKFISWRLDETPKTPILWLNGILGAGKTVLASGAIDNCTEDGKALTAYVYCKYGDLQRTTFIPVLKTIIKQLLVSGHILLPWCYEEFLNSNQLSLSSEKTCRKIASMVLLSSDKTYLIVDGLDECEQSQRKLLLTCFIQMVSECDYQNPGKTRILLVSRDEPDIRRGLGVTTFSEILIREGDNKRDMQRFIDTWCQKIKMNFEELEEDHLEYIATSTLQRAEGMFLFAKLVMMNLFEQVFLDDLLEQIRPENFPAGLEEAYARILDRISRNNKQSSKVVIAKQILGWMTCARRPLKWHEIQGAISTNTKDRTIDFTQRFRIHIREICGSLINELSGERLELVHSTAKHYLIQSAFVQPKFIESYLGSLCLNYLMFECFDEDLSHDERRKFLCNGYFAFQDYAVTHWSDHIGAIIKAGRGAFESPSDEDEVGSAVTNFVAHYKLDVQELTETEKNSEACLQFEGCPFFDDICYISRHIQHQRSRGLSGLDEISPKSLDHAVISARAMLEKCALSNKLDYGKISELILFYGQNWYKCPKATCYYFHEGFSDLRSKQYHVARHEQPFRCGFPDCERGYRLGFTSRKELEKHLSIFHPTSGKIVATFSRLKKAHEKGTESRKESPSRAQIPANFACPTCPKRYTRKENLVHHMRTHANEKPYQCSQCESRFVRDNDRKRHEKTHSGEKKYVCHGELNYGAPGENFWGCKKAFPRADALASHFRSEAGRACLKPVADEVRVWREAQWGLPVNQRKALELKMPLTRQLIERFPELLETHSDDAEAASLLLYLSRQPAVPRESEERA